MTYFSEVLPDFDSGYSFLCNQITEAECFGRMLFGARQSKLAEMQRITEKTAIFLYRLGKLPRLYGIFIKAGEASYNIEPSAFVGRFPAQIRVREPYRFPNPLTDDALNVFKGSKNRLLNQEETKAIIQLFFHHNRAVSLPTNNQQYPPYTTHGMARSSLQGNQVYTVPSLGDAVPVYNPGNPFPQYDRGFPNQAYGANNGRRRLKDGTTAGEVQQYPWIEGRRSLPQGQPEDTSFNFLKWRNLLTVEKKKCQTLESELEFERDCNRKLEKTLAEEKNVCQRCPKMEKQMIKLEKGVKWNITQIEAEKKRVKEQEAANNKAKASTTTAASKADELALVAKLEAEKKTRIAAEKKLSEIQKRRIEEAKTREKSVQGLRLRVENEKKKGNEHASALKTKKRELEDRERIIEQQKLAAEKNEDRKMLEEAQSLLGQVRKKTNMLSEELDKARNGFVAERLKKAETQQALEVALSEKMELEKALSAEKARASKLETEFEEEKKEALEKMKAAAPPPAEIASPQTPGESKKPDSPLKKDNYYSSDRSQVEKTRMPEEKSPKASNDAYQEAPTIQEKPQVSKDAWGEEIVTKPTNRSTSKSDQPKSPPNTDSKNNGKTDNKEKQGDKPDEIDPDKFASNWDEICHTFDDMDLNSHLLRGIFSYGYERPSYIQQRGVIPMLKGFDIIAQAQSGTGKTGCFLIAGLSRINSKEKATQVLVLSPTRELATQTHKVAIALAEYMSDLCAECVIGGTNIWNDVQAISKGVQLIVGTPGRINALLDRNQLQVHKLKSFVLDEADEMLSRGLKAQIYEVFKYLPKDTQVCLFSATMPVEILQITENIMRDPVRILVKKEELTLAGIKQFYVAIEKEEWKLEALFDLYESLTIAQAIIFCNTRSRTEWLAEKMLQHEFTVSAMHGDLPMDKRTMIMKEFRSGSSRVLISSDVLARGIDVHQVSLVINYDLPIVRENYIHRVGRSGRYGRKGVAINLVTDKSVTKLREIEQFYNTEIQEMPMDVAGIFS